MVSTGEVSLVIQLSTTMHDCNYLSILSHLLFQKQLKIPQDGLKHNKYYLKEIKSKQILLKVLRAPIMSSIISSITWGRQSIYATNTIYQLALVFTCVHGSTDRESSFTKKKHVRCARIPPSWISVTSLKSKMALDCFKFRAEYLANKKDIIRQTSY